jgi:hypothetical protein
MTRERTCWIGQIKGRGRHARIEAKATHDARRIAGETLELLRRVEDDLVGVGHSLVDLVVGPGNRIGVRLAAETLAAKAHFVERRRGRAVHVLAHHVEHRPGREALQRQKRLGTGLLADAIDLLHVGKKLRFVDEIIGRAQFGFLGHGVTVLGAGCVGWNEEK